MSLRYLKILTSKEKRFDSKFGYNDWRRNSTELKQLNNKIIRLQKWEELLQMSNKEKISGYSGQGRLVSKRQNLD